MPRPSNSILSDKTIGINKGFKVCYSWEKEKYGWIADVKRWDEDVGQFSILASFQSKVYCYTFNQLTLKEYTVLGPFTCFIW
jgi:hypothetical protein